MTLIKGHLWCNIKTSDDIQRALNAHPSTKEIRVAAELKDLEVEGVRMVFERDVPAGHIFLMGGD